VRGFDSDATRAKLDPNTMSLRVVEVLSFTVADRERLWHVLDLLRQKHEIVADQLISLTQQRVEWLIRSVGSKRHGRHLVSADQP